MSVLQEQISLITAIYNERSYLTMIKYMKFETRKNGNYVYTFENQDIYFSFGMIDFISNKGFKCEYRIYDFCLDIIFVHENEYERFVEFQKNMK
jgi:hypothetical protein